MSQWDNIASVLIVVYRFTSYVDVYLRTGSGAVSASAFTVARPTLWWVTEFVYMFLEDLIRHASLNYANERSG